MKIRDAHHYPEVEVPLFWPFSFALGLEEAALDRTAQTLKFLDEVEKTQVEREPPGWATENRVRLELGGKVALARLCQGGWCAAMYAARFPHKVARLVLAGSPIDTDAGDGAIKQAVHTLPMRVEAAGELDFLRHQTRGLESRLAKLDDLPDSAWNTLREWFKEEASMLSRSGGLDRSSLSREGS